MTKKEFIEGLDESRNYIYVNELLSSYFVGGNCIGKRRSPGEQRPDRGRILIITERFSGGGSYKLKPYGWYDEMYFELRDIKDDDSVLMYTSNGDGIVNEYLLFLEDLIIWDGPLPELEK
jgi:hypothetical protein